ncbi:MULTISPECIES: hypothetical protein [Klebsiella]|uniref:hypothetical protein n=1 Tax=Enterobacteriaceae TaxID=543 RepID=UPI001CB719E3|nr:MULTISPECIES: hypothetical protein [Klebsiella]MCD9724290.1 hypothetical protein [Klebsiella pneumoniae]MCM5819930.1 hypothetical protein [Klebsiella pneumoniae]MCP6241178.1 hypothetical protein [Klebsiella pneumoniae]MCQ0485379.1 hypothetical protein [Klebsiella pneumoniae]MCQ0490803.1 hypothetical protein [Klebsiella pneumoniae]
MTAGLLWFSILLIVSIGVPASPNDAPTALLWCPITALNGCYYLKSGFRKNLIDNMNGTFHILNKKLSTGGVMGRVMQEMKKSDGKIISIYERDAGWSVVMSYSSECLASQNFGSYAEAESYARTLSGMPANEDLPWEHLVTSTSTELK